MRTITRRPTALLMAAAVLLLALTQVAGATARPERVDKGGGRRLPLVIGHRGASGYRPDATAARLCFTCSSPAKTPTPHGRLASPLDLPPGGGHRGYAAVVDGSGSMVACWCSHSMGGK